jgi:hypothetical protein
MVDLSGLKSDQLHRVGQDVPAQKTFFLKKDVLGQLQTVQSRFLPKTVDLSQH